MITLYILLLTFFCSCEDTITLKSTQLQKVEEEKFEVFYNKFLSDSVFQLSRIKFPLLGECQDWGTTGLDEKGNPSSDKFVWNKDSWDILRKVNKSDAVDYDFKVIKEENKIIRTMKGKSFGFYLEETYERLEGKWYLTYFIERDL